MENAISEMNEVDFAIVVGKFAFDLEHYEHADAESIISKWWNWTDEIAQSLLDANEASAVYRFKLIPTETCPECYSDTDKYEGVIEHDSECNFVSKV
jgi:hypothetical protein